MEETVWLYFSVMAIIVLFGIIGFIVYQNADDVKAQTALRSLDELERQCTYICDLGIGTVLPMEVTFPSGLYLYTNGKKICGTFNEENDCRVCKCDLVPYELALNSTFIRKAFSTHPYTCTFERASAGVSLSCQG